MADCNLCVAVVGNHTVPIWERRRIRVKWHFTLRYCFDKKCKCPSKNRTCHSNTCKNKWALSLLFITPTLHLFLMNKLLSTLTVPLKVILLCGSFVPQHVVVVWKQPQCIVAVSLVPLRISFSLNERFLSLSVTCTRLSSIQKNLWNQHAVFYYVCWLVALLKIFETFNFP